MNPIVRRVLITVGSIMAAALIAVAFWLVFFPPVQDDPDAEPQPSGVATIEPGELEEDEHVHEGPELDEDNQHMHAECTEEDVQRDTASGGGFCGPVSALSGGEVIQLMDAHTAQLTAFARQWVTYSSDESPAARSERLRKAGATDEVALTPSVFSRTDTSQAGLTGSSSPLDVGIITPVDRDDIGVYFNVPVNVSASYRLPTGQGNDQRTGGSLTVWVNDSGAIVKVTEHFPAMSDMR